jgi:hypothetical protein
MLQGQTKRPKLAQGPFQIEVVDPGLEPGTHGFSVRCSTN